MTDFWNLKKTKDYKKAKSRGSKHRKSKRIYFRARRRDYEGKRRD